jgi:hypothetical protein
MKSFKLTTLFFVSILTILGCQSGGADPTETVVTGQVLLDGKALTMGEVYLENESGAKSGQGEIDAEGNFRVPSCPIGKVKAAVRTSTYAQFASNKTQGGKAVTMGGRAGTYVPVPKKYEETSTSKLTYDIKKDAVLKIELSGK